SDGLRRRRAHPALETAADDLAQYRHWQPFLHDIGECEVKHGVRLGLVNLYRDDLGNPALPEKLRDAPAAKRQIPWPALFILLVSLGATIFGIVLFYQNSPPQRPLPPAAPAPFTPTPAESGIPEKSIAVLPFENLSEEKANAYFADGIQDEILTNLAKIAALKVISRTSVMQYRTGTTRNLREIGKQLGVAHLLEGSVQRNAGKVRVIAQLIDARTDAHLWAETYDRDLADVFAIQSDIARSIAAQLQAKLAPEEKARLAAKPTDNSQAYLLYLQANEAVYVAASGGRRAGRRAFFPGHRARSGICPGPGARFDAQQPDVFRRTRTAAKNPGATSGRRSTSARASSGRSASRSGALFLPARGRLREGSWGAGNRGRGLA
ncbi:MAG: hypothetical protein M3Q46_13450, partial [Verrucomicrobiota bacterium]|nr:hypothetical protein [Verrucomicrobiota bacterium]